MIHLLVDANLALTSRSALILGRRVEPSVGRPAVIK